VIESGRHRVASAEPTCDTDQVRSPGSLSFAFGPIVALTVVLILALLLRWAFGRGRSLVSRRPRPGSPDEYGLLVPIATPSTFIEAEVIKQHLEAAGLRCTLAPTTQGPRVLVFPQDVPAARLALRGYRPPG
jgi:hypothetical protein